jgi:subtilisin
MGDIYIVILFFYVFIYLWWVILWGDVVGVAPKCQIVIAKVLGDDGSGSTDQIAAGVDYLVDAGCDIISMSLGGGSSPQLAASIARATQRGVFIICAAGNDGMVPGSQVGCPADLPETLAVASYNKQGNLSDFSTRGPEVDIAFPGENILSTWLGGAYKQLSGTSMATPFCSGLVAELLGQQRKADREGRTVTTRIKTYNDLLTQIKKSAIDKGPVGYDQGWGWGVVDTAKFLDTTAKSGGSNSDINLGLFRMRPVTIDGKSGYFIYIP